MRTLAAAVMLLTRIPMPVSAGTVAPGRAAALYPLVGAFIGLGVGGVALGASHLWPPLIAAALAVAFEVVLTGALHLDGLADCADGLAGRDREHRLRIMKDHGVGVYASATLVLHLGLKVLTISGLSFMEAPVVLLAALYAISRAAMLPLARLLPYARADGTGRGVVEGLGNTATWIGVAQGLVAVAAIVWIEPVPAIVVLLAVALVAGLVGLLAHRRLGGVTGDVLGACAELTLIAGLLTLVA